MQEDVMDKRYGMSAGLSALERISLLAFCGFLVICWLCTLYAGHYAPRTVFAGFIWVSLYVSLTFLFLMIVRLIIARDMIRTEWVVTDTSIIRKSPARIVTVDFCRLVRFRFLHVPMLLSVGSIRHEAGTMFISFYMENLPGFIADVRAGIDQSASPSVYDASNLEEYSRIARYAELRNGRLKRYMPSLLSSLILSLSVSIVTALYLWHFPLVLTFLWTVIVLCLFLSAVLIAEAVLFVASRGTALPKSPACEFQVYLLAGIFSFVICLCCGILLTTTVAI
jgi:hypothetical protein